MMELLNVMNKIIYVWKYDKREFETSCWTIKEVAVFLKRDVSSVYASMSRLRKLKKEDIVLKDYAGNKHLIILEKELQGKKWYK